MPRSPRLLITIMACSDSPLGMNPPAVLTSIQTGFGGSPGFIAVVLDSVAGWHLHRISCGGRVLADWLLEKFGRERAVWGSYYYLLHFW